MTEEQFVAGTSKELGSKDRMKFKVGGLDHHVGLVSVTASTATLEISSEPQTATLSIGDERKFDVSNDGYYDVRVMLVGITSKKAEINLKSIHEEITIETEGEEEEEEEAAAAVRKSEEEKEKRKIWTGIIIVVVVVLVLIGGGTFIKKKSNTPIKKQ